MPPARARAVGRRRVPRRARAVALVVGVDRGVGAEVLRDAGAHVVVSDLAEFLDGDGAGIPTAALAPEPEESA